MTKSDTISVVAELERIGWDFKWSGENTVKCKCPFHDDESPSCSVDVKTTRFRCYTAGCKKEGDIVTFLARCLETSRAVVQSELSKRYILDDDDKTIEGTVVEKAHVAIWEAKGLLKELADRAVTADLVRKFRLGEMKGRISIPVKNASGVFVNIRKYLPGAPGKDKMRNVRGHGKIRLYPIDQLSYPKIVIFGGEIKAIAATPILNEMGIGCISTTGGEGNWDHQFTTLIAGKKTWICFDIDKEGIIAAKQVAGLIHRFVPWVGIVELPLDPEEHPHGDINDFLASGGDLPETLSSTTRYDITTLDDDLADKDPEDVQLIDACSAENVAKPIRIETVVTAIGQAPFSVPSSLQVRCPRDQKFCGICPVYPNPEDHVYGIRPDSSAVLAMVGATNAGKHEILLESLKIPKQCRACIFSEQSFFNVEDVRLSPKMNVTNNATDREMLPAVCVGKGLELNESYKMTGRMFPHPKNQQATIVLSDFEVMQDALSNYDPGDTSDLEIFQGDPNEKLNEIYEDLEANVTRIFQRRDVHLGTDLAYHSPLWIMFDDKPVKGWVEILIAGDSSQGKTETTKELMAHYDAGTKVDCKNASVAGLMGGLQQIAGKWFVTWGAIPNNDRRLVVLEELKGASTDTISRLTDMRSSGVAEIPKIENRRTYSRTRLIALSNARSGLEVSSYNFGLQIVPEIVGALEDVRRFDAAVIVSNRDVEAEVLNRLRSERPEVEHVYTSALCRRLVLWSWTRAADDIQFVDGAESEILARSIDMCNSFSEAVPLVDRGSQRNKVARLSAALAARLFSTDDGKRLLVKPEHVRYICDWLDRVYSSDAFGYRRFSESVKAASEIKDVDQILAAINKSPFASDLVENLIATDEIEAQDIQDWCGWERNSASQLVSVLVRKRALVRNRRSYRKTPEFIGLLKEWVSKNAVITRPDYIPEQETEF